MPGEHTFGSIDDLGRYVDGLGGVATLYAGQLRTPCGVVRLAKNNRETIKRVLKSHGLGHFPEEIPNWQETLIRVYRRGSNAGELIDAVLTTGPAEDMTIRQWTATKASEMVQAIRELVCS